MHSSPFELSSPGSKRYFDREEEIYADSIDRHQKVFVKRSKDMLRGRIEPHENDVLMGRGGKNNQHSGNEKLRQFARLECERYRVSTKKGKSNISRELVRKMQELEPPARFLKRNQDTNDWEEVAEDTAREKTSQVLRDAVAALLGSSSSQQATEATYDDHHLHEQRHHEEQTVERRHHEQHHYEQSHYEPHRTEHYDMHQRHPQLRHSYHLSYSYSSDIITPRQGDEHAQSLPAAGLPVVSYDTEAQHDARPVTVSSFPPATPSRKRSRTPTHPNTYAVPYSAPNNLHYSPVRRQPVFDHPGYAHSMYGGDPNPQGTPPRRSTHDGSTGLLGDVAETMNEFDLFNGELLDSDPEDHQPRLRRRLRRREGGF